MSEAFLSRHVQVPDPSWQNRRRCLSISWLILVVQYWFFRRPVTTIPVFALKWVPFSKQELARLLTFTRKKIVPKLILLQLSVIKTSRQAHPAGSESFERHCRVAASFHLCCDSEFKASFNLSFPCNFCSQWRLRESKTWSCSSHIQYFWNLRLRFRPIYWRITSGGVSGYSITPRTGRQWSFRTYCKRAFSGFWIIKRFLLWP